MIFWLLVALLIIISTLLSAHYALKAVTVHLNPHSGRDLKFSLAWAGLSTVLLLLLHGLYGSLLMLAAVAGYIFLLVKPMKTLVRRISSFIAADN